MFERVLLIAFLSGVVIARDQNFPCRFAGLFSPQEILEDSKVQYDFIEHVAFWEGHFHQDGIGMNLQSGLTYDGHPLNYSTGEAVGTPHLFSASSKESIHVNMLTLALAGDPRAALFVNYANPNNATETAVEILTNKINSYEQYNEQFPGFGGFFPWFGVADSGMIPLNGWTDTVPGLDNGQLAWAIYALIPNLQNAGYKQLASRYQAQLQRMIDNCMTIFYDGGGRIRAVTKIANVSLPPSENTYTSNAYYLDDPYEGELMAFFMDLFGAWKNVSEREEIWEFKRPMLQSVDYQTLSGPITVQKGWWFSAHEQWKLLVLPYLEVDIAKRVFTNCERARTVNSAALGVPGLYASVNDVSKGGQPADYISAAGIQEIAFSAITRTDVITPYGSMASFLTDLGVGLAWYQNILLGPRMQGPYGSTEAVNLNGTEISPLTTWDSKVTSLVGMLGGISNITSTQMMQDGVYDRFTFVVNREYSLKFPSLKGESIPFGLPSLSIPTDFLGYFPTCENL
eukprot:TRINITY_DN1762_c0_g1_i1.p1 TRINITY_DN1762_c0_g1~~TRINITY_DN1762_c0_g1_i1.p1  ORF type:complete len:513 (+),score=91.94 TRINITY_DN1762_c0_g1_i1:144-1682(+)